MELAVFSKDKILYLLEKEYDFRMALIEGLAGAFFVDYMSETNSFPHKPAAAIVSARRAGTTATIDLLNKYFQIT